ncbi:hypothetical protein CON36_32540 [Bacillus cereus]|uniref:SbsA Ig-like domain-containing protein n=1 Tax=Bacillus cereus TaxID=1396 RepID=A0A9X6XVC5_BACCE|nr:Ig-like domain-containing protein [Bacillus cereus]PDZ94682.1 hypothetical protein CON36_32540 [Bacillus cereus]
MQKKYVMACSAFLFASILTGCGGTSEETEVKVENTEKATDEAKTSILPKQENITKGKPVVVDLGEKVDASSVTKNAIYVENATKEKVEIETKVQDTQILVTPLVDLKEKQNFTLHVTDKLKNEKGKRINKSYKLEFEMVPESTVKESTKQESAKKEPTKQDSAKKESTIKESPKQEEAKKKETETQQPAQTEQGKEQNKENVSTASSSTKTQPQQTTNNFQSYNGEWRDMGHGDCDNGVYLSLNFKNSNTATAHSQALAFGTKAMSCGNVQVDDLGDFDVTFDANGTAKVKVPSGRSEMTLELTIQLKNNKVYLTPKELPPLPDIKNSFYENGKTYELNK